MEMEYEVYYYVDCKGNEWLTKNISVEDVKDAIMYWKVLVEETPDPVEKCAHVWEPVIGEVVYCNGLGTVRILRIISGGGAHNKKTKEDENDN